MRRLLSILVTGILASSAFAGIASAHHKDGHDANYHGMCTAMFSGSENGQQNKRDNSSAYEAFEDTVRNDEGGNQDPQEGEEQGDRDGDGDFDLYDVADFCVDETGGFGNPGQGNEPFFGDADQGDDSSVTEDDGDGTGHPNGQGNGNTKNS